MDRIRILTKEQCEEIARVINNLRDSWITRNDLGFFSLGAAAYLDAPTQETIDSFTLEKPINNTYTDTAAQYNDLLWAHFSKLYQAVKEALAIHFDTDVEYAVGKAKPGFHVFNHNPRNAKSTSHVPHYDRQYEGLDWGCDVTVHNAQTFSFTLPVKLPSAGAGLYLWQLRLEDVLTLEKSEALKLVKAAKIRREPYFLGELICHPGHQLHRIAPWVSEHGEQRITLQGHGLYLNGCWQLYW